MIIDDKILKQAEIIADEVMDRYAKNPFCKMLDESDEDFIKRIKLTNEIFNKE